jgi:hypothetical protein
MNRQRHLLAIVALWLGACAQAPSGSAPPGQATTGASGGIGARPPGPPRESRSSGWALANEYTYRVSLSTLLSFNGGHAFDFDLTGSLRVVPTRVSAQELTLYLTVDGAKIVSRVPDTQPQFDKIAAEVSSTGCFIDFVEGRVRAMHTAPALSGLAANLYREIGADLQFSTGNEARYSVEEYDTTGKYLAQYEELGPEHFSKQKQRYLSVLGLDLPGNGKVSVLPEVVSSLADFTLAKSGRPSLIRSKNEVLVNGAQAPVRSITSASFESTSERAISAGAFDFASLLAKTTLTPADQPYGNTATVDALDDARIRGRTFEQLYAEVVAVSKTGGGQAQVAKQSTVDQNAQVFISLAALLRRKSETVARAVAKIRANAVGASVLMDALSSASSPASEQALVALSTDSTLKPELRQRAQRVLTRVQRPTDAVVHAQQAVLAQKPFDDTALLTLGSYCRRFRDQGDATRAGAIGELLMDRLRAANSESSTISVLRALTNAGYDKGLAPVQRYLSDAREQVRVAAVRSLQSVHDPAVDAAIAATLSNDASSAVRISAIDAAVVREPSDEVAKALSRAALSADDTLVRFRAVDLMSQWLQRRPAFRGVLEAVASRDAEPKVRERAQSAL